MTPMAFAALMDRAYTQMRPWSEADVASILTQENAVFLSAPSGGLLARFVADECEILALATEPKAHRRGIATSLVSELLKVAAPKGVHRLLLEVAEHNTQARNFYATQGFAEIGRRKRYYTLRDGRKDDALLLSRSLSQGQTAQASRAARPRTKSG